MNCLLLLIILFCCNGNGNSGRRSSCGGTCNTRKSCDLGCGSDNGNNRDIRNHEHCGNDVRRECGCEGNANFHSHNAPPPMARAQFPYLDVEPRTCGCEENSQN